MSRQKHYLYKILTALLLVLSSTALKASETRQMQFSQITLPYDANVVEGICKDSQGMMWFATRRGLFAYDGYNIRRLYEGNYHAIVKIDGNILCLGGDSGLRWLNIRTEKFVDPYGNVPETGEVRSLACENDILYVGTKSHGVFCLDLKKKVWKNYIIPNRNSDIIFSFGSAKNRMYIAHYAGLAYLDSEGHIQDMGIDDNVYAVWYDQENTKLWVGTEHHLLCLNVRDGKTKIIESGSTYNQIVPSPTGDLFIASEFGLKVLHLKTGSIQTISHDAFLPQNGLPSNAIHQIFCEGNGIWIATDRGVAFTHLENTFEKTRLPAISNSHDGNVFTQILVAKNGDEWLGGDNGLLHKTKDNTKWFKVGNGLKKSIIRRIFEDTDQQIWIATDASIARYDPRRDQFDYFLLKDHKGRNANWAYDIYEDHKGRLWVATYMGGLYVVDKKTLLASDGKYTVEEIFFKNQDEIVNTIYKFLPDNDGVLWANTSKGLATINTNTFEVNLKQGMFIDNMILVNGIIWIDVQGQLFRYDTQKGIKDKTDFLVKDGMIYSFVHENNRIWMSTTNGLFYIDTDDNSIHPYRKIENSFTAGIYVSSNHTILWGGEDIICRQFLQQRHHIDKTVSQVFLSSVTVDGIPIDNCIPRFEKTIIELNGREDIILDLATFSYNNKDSETFWYKIGENGEWHSLPNGTNRIMIPHLSGGNYTVYLSTDAHHGKDTVSKYLFKVPYPWYLRWWAWMLYLISILSLILVILYYYKQREKRRFEQREREQVMALTQQKMDFFVDMSHELKTPLSLIIAPISKLLSETSNAKLRSSLKSIQNNAMRLNDLIHRILDFKQLEVEGESQILSSHIDLCNLISGCIDEFAELAKERHVKILFQHPETPVIMDVDVVKIQIVVRNILSNALKYIEQETGEIIIQVERESSVVFVTISDNGPGVSNNDLPKLFNRYYMGQKSQDGSGIGLSVVKKYIELHGGEVKAENNKGLTIKFSLPVNMTSDKGITDNTPNDSSEKPIILIVDDNHEILEFLTTALESSYQCETALSGEIAMKTIETTVPDIIITDQMMPGIDGTELCHRLRHHHATKLVPIIMLTAKDDTNTEMKSIRSGADVFMPKPFDLRKLQLHIVQLLNKRRAIEQSSRINNLRTVQEDKPSLTNEEELMERIISLINSNMHSEEFNVTKLCDLLCMDQKQLYRKLKQLTGETPVSFIRKQRMNRAAVLLKKNRFTISEVMFQVGFSSASYFTKSFTREFGVSPKEYVSST